VLATMVPAAVVVAILAPAVVVAAVVPAAVVVIAAPVATIGIAMVEATEAVVAAPVAALGIAAIPAVTPVLPAGAAPAIAIVPAVVRTAIGAAPLLAAVPGLLAVVALAIDIAVLALDHAVDVGALLLRDMTIGHGARLSAIDRTLSLFEAVLL